ncbi:hypothetical protein [Muricoccus vinaceus]|uniref:Uncharacterized protein n=1 Tax=Muricoccus vinaceus TaxID=424704 RepID=A0ABV6IP78_9PROT
MFRLTTLGAATALPGCVTVPQGHVPRSTLATTDADPADGVGHGRTRYAAPPSHRVTDSDPSDGVGRGRYAAPPHPGTTDHDPSDGPGRGRGTHARPARRAATDSDPSDDVGRGRRRR